MSAQQRGGEPLVGPAQLRTLQGHRPAGRLDGHRLVAVAIPRVGVRAALVAVPAKERSDLSLQRGLQQQPRPEPGDLLDHLAQITGRVGEQLVYLGADALNGRSS